MSDLLKAASQVDTAAVDTMSVTPRGSVNPYSSKLVSSMKSDATLWERMAELETTVKDGFDKIMKILSNTPGRMSGGRRRTHRSKRTRSK
jgi:hypothetical protein